MATTKNLGQVAGVHIGSIPPENTILIWYDNTPSQNCHKVYDTAKKTWVILDQKIISYITYSELVNIAKNVGLSVGKFYQITDKSNALAIAITTTKVQYDDALGNILIDDLGTNIQYHVTSSNLQIDDISGVFDENNKKLVFRFNETVPDFTADDYIMGKISRNNVWSLAKYKLSSFLSKVTGNSISWNGGFYFNFGTTLRSYLDKKGGVVAKDTYDTDMKQINTSVQNVGKENQQIIQNANTAIEAAASDTAVYNKTLPSDLETGGEAIDAAKGDRLITILSKFQRYINKFKYATGIKISSNFKEATDPEYINNNDTVDSAFSKVQYWLKNIYGTLSLSKNFQPETDPSYGTPIPECAPNDPIETAIAKLQGVLNDIGTITDGNIKSKQKAYNSSGEERGSKMEIDMRSGAIKILGDRYQGAGNSADVTLQSGASSNLYIYDSVNSKSAHLGVDGLYANGGGQTSGYPYNGHSTANLFITGSWGDATLPNIMDDWYAGLYAWANNSYSGSYPKWVYGAYIERLCAAGLLLRTSQLNDSDSGTTLGSLGCYYSCYNTSGNITLNLPAKPQKGQCLWIRQVNANGIVLNGNGKEIVRNENTSGGSSSVTVSERGALYFLLFDGQYWMMNKQNN